jgi:hypothetical protein
MGKREAEGGDNDSQPVSEDTNDYSQLKSFSTCSLMNS